LEQDIDKKKTTKKKSKLRQKESVDDKAHAILQLDLESDVERVYYQREFIKIIENFMVDEDSYISIMRETDYLGMLSFYDSIFKLFKEDQ